MPANQHPGPATRAAPHQPARPARPAQPTPDPALARMARRLTLGMPQWPEPLGMNELEEMAAYASAVLSGPVMTDKSAGAFQCAVLASIVSSLLVHLQRPAAATPPTPVELVHRLEETDGADDLWFLAPQLAAAIKSMRRELAMLRRELSDARATLVIKETT